MGGHQRIPNCGMCCPCPSVHPSLLHPLTSPFHVHQPLRLLSVHLSPPSLHSLPSPPRRPPSFSRCARLHPSHSRRRSRPGRPSPRLRRPSPWHLDCSISDAGIRRGGGAGAAEAGRWERPREVQDDRQGMSIVHHRSRPGLTAPLGSGGKAGPGRAPGLPGQGPEGTEMATGLTNSPTSMRGVWPQPEKGCGKGGGSSMVSRCSAGMAVLLGQAPLRDRLPSRMGIPLEWASLWNGHPPGTVLPLEQAPHRDGNSAHRTCPEMGFSLG